MEIFVDGGLFEVLPAIVFAYSFNCIFTKKYLLWLVVLLWRARLQFPERSLFDIDEIKNKLMKHKIAHKAIQQNLQCRVYLSSAGKMVWLTGNIKPKNGCHENFKIYF